MLIFYWKKKKANIKLYFRIIIKDNRVANVKCTLEYINILTKFRIDLWQECDEMFITCCDFYGQIFRCSERKSLVFEMRRKMFVPHSEPIFLLFFFLFFLFHFLRENMFPKNSVLSGNELILLYMVNIDANTFSFIHIYLKFRVEHQKIFFFQWAYHHRFFIWKL